MSSPKTLHIHVGIHKTGSTALQEALPKLNTELGTRGFHYYTDDRYPKRFSSLTYDDPYSQEWTRQHFTERISPLPHPEIVFSTESLSGNPYKGYPNVPFLASQLDAITADHKRHIILFVRRQDTFVESLYRQSIHQGASDSFETFLDLLPSNAFDWRPIVAAYDTQFGQENVTVRPYEEASAAGGILPLFLDILGLKDIGPPPPTVGNRSFSNPAINLARYAYRQLTFSVQQKGALRDILQAGETGNHFPQTQLFTPDQRQAYLAPYLEANAELAERFDTGFTTGYQPPPDLAKEAPAPPDKPQALDLEDLSFAVASLARAVADLKLPDRQEPAGAPPPTADPSGPLLEKIEQLEAEKKELRAELDALSEKKAPRLHWFRKT